MVFVDIVVEENRTDRESKFSDRLLDLLHWDECLIEGQRTTSDKAEKELNGAIAELKRFLKGQLKKKQVHASVQLWLLLRDRTYTGTPSGGAVDFVRVPQPPGACSEQVD